jgi:hypothetical protein
MLGVEKFLFFERIDDVFLFIFAKNFKAMASRKVLKRDIDYMTSELLSDCVLYVDLYPAQPTEPVTEIINGVLLKKQEVFSKINTPTSKMEKKAVKENYKGYISEMLTTINEGYERLSKLPRK